MQTEWIGNEREYQMADEIKISFKNLDEAVEYLSGLEVLIDVNNYNVKGKLDESSGETFQVICDALDELQEIDNALCKLIAKTRSVVKNAGISYKETDNAIKEAIIGE